MGIEVLEHLKRDGVYRKYLWSTILGLVPSKDGNQWSVLYGNNIQEGISGYGDTPELAMIDFDRAMISKRGK